MKKQVGSIIVWLFAAAMGYGDYSIDWYTIDGGGGKSTGGEYIVTGTIAQPDAAYSQSEEQFSARRILGRRALVRR